MTKNRYKSLALETGYWRPGTDYIQKIANAVGLKLKEGDFVTISEKAISIASNNIIDERNIHSSMLARFIAKYWMRLAWGYFLGVACHMRNKTIQHMRAYPLEEGGAHKQVALSYAGFCQALMYGSEGGIDGSNLPYFFVSLPLNNAKQIAKQIREHLKRMFDKNVNIVILDTDKTYSFKNFHFTPRPKPIEGIYSCNGFVSYLIGRFLNLKRRATPVAFDGCQIDVEEILNIAELADRRRGFGGGTNVWDMARGFNVDLGGVTWDMLDLIEHKAIVLVRQEDLQTN